MGIERKQILIIDDQADARLILGKILEAAGCSVIEAEDVPQGLSLAKEMSPHLIFCDLRMPGQTGFDFLKSRQNDPILNAIPVIVVSGVQERELVREAIDLKANDYIVKPIKTGTVLKKLRKQLKDRSFVGYQFEKPKKRPKVSIRAFGTITHVHEAGMRLRAPLKLKENTVVDIQSSILNVLGVNAKRFSTFPKSAFFDESQYENRLSFVGLSYEEAKSIRRKIENLK